mmetsp:Transcript_54622/g.106855  ORF Transcript_54622/g.106855 Transcript_54622/m.106855 type:complete len:285 (-) Transcript_54622:1793-2647(-)
MRSIEFVPSVSSRATPFLYFPLTSSLQSSVTVPSRSSFERKSLSFTNTFNFASCRAATEKTKVCSHAGSRVFLMIRVFSGFLCCAVTPSAPSSNKESTAYGSLFPFASAALRLEAPCTVTFRFPGCCSHCALAAASGPSPASLPAASAWPSSAKSFWSANLNLTVSFPWKMMFLRPPPGQSLRHSVSTSISSSTVFAILPGGGGKNRSGSRDSSLSKHSGAMRLNSISSLQTFKGTLGPSCLLLASDKLRSSFAPEEEEEEPSRAKREPNHISVTPRRSSGLGG